VVTNFHASDFPNLERQNFCLVFGPQQVSVLARNYAQGGPGELFAIEGSSGYLEVSVSQGSAAKQIGCESGAVVEIWVG